MKQFLIAICILVLTANAAAAKGYDVPQFIAQATNPDPFNTRRVAQGEATPVPTPVTAPVVVATPAPTPIQFDNNTIHTVFYGIITAILGWIGIKLPAMMKPSGVGANNINDIVAAALNPQNAGTILKDPDLKAAVDVALLKAIQSGIPGQAIQTGLGFIPGAGPLASTFEPMIRSLVEDIVQKRIDALRAAKPVVTP